MKKTILRKQWLCAIAMVVSMLSTNGTFAQTMSNSGTRAWFCAGTGSSLCPNWSGNVMPTTNGNVIINSTGTLEINMNSVSSVTLSSFTTQGSAAITMNSSGSATITTNAFTINRSFNFSRPFILTGTGTVASSQTLTCGANLTLNSGATLTVNGTLVNTSNTITVKSGALLIFGSGSNPPSRINVEAGGEIRFLGSGSVTGLTTSNIYGKVSFQGTRVGASGFNATYQNGSTLEYKGNSAQTAYFYEMKSSGISNIIIDNSSGVTFASSLPPSPSINGTLTLTNGILNFGNNVSSKITFTGNNPIVRTNGTINASGTYATLIFNNSTGNFTLPNNLFNNTTVTRLQVNMPTTGSTLTLNNQNITVSQLLLTKGHLAVGSGNLTFGELNSTFGNSTLNNTSMIVTPNAGFLCYNYPVGETSSVIFPLGETTGTTEYTPLTLGFTSNSATRTIGFKITDGFYANTGSASNYLTRYFSIYAPSITGTYEYSLTTKYNSSSGDVNGTVASIQPAVYDGSVWNLYPGAINTSLNQVEYTSATQTTGPLGNGYVYMGRFVTEVPTTITWYLDADTDGYYIDTQISATSPGEDWTSTEGISGDCDDNDPTVWRSGSFYVDADGDGYTVGGSESVCYGELLPSEYTETSLGLDCDDSDDTIYPGATEICYDGILQNCAGELTDGCPPVLTQIRPYFNGTTLQHVNSSILADTPTGLPNGATVTGYRYEITNLSTTAVREVEKTIAMIRISETDIAGFNTAYSIRVMVRINNEWQDYGTSCEINTPSVPTTSISSTVCGKELQSLQAGIYAITVTSALGYEFEVSRIEGGTSVETTTIERSTNNFKITQLSGIDYVYAAEYQVRVRVKADVNGEVVWSLYGATCSVFTPEAPEATIVSCGGEQGITPTSMTTPIYATPLTGATQYRFTLSDGVSYNQVYTTSARFFRLSNFNALQTLTPGGNYSVTVEAEIYGYFYPGKDCNILVPGGGLRSNLVKTEETINLPTEFKAVAYPNPFANSFAVDVRTSNTEKVSLTVYDMAGRLLEVKEVNASEVANYQFGDRYPSGVYNMIVTQGEETRTVRVVKQ
ncbi:T9SS type A sorting domain-containing protein [Flavobacterium azooxidireducens]|uniref:T9SS type A sorting domain-containing protein n=1 Tax=Flavobacterium azooxidireducens TaxID=1871076 RepID=A0ABY4KDK3_9FLAO|nr:T9SS type A sorting domain-containing protein [Flavobacterium azooxidireducens]UPQ78888.1 T9SS type A sorting domain-containing protein [Flavobacterium azooxidireducens]